MVWSLPSGNTTTIGRSTILCLMAFTSKFDLWLKALTLKWRSTKLVLDIRSYMRVKNHGDLISELNLKLITLRGGKQYMMLDGYTYYRHVPTKAGFRWSCTNSSKCHARIVVTQSGHLVSADGDHIHARPRYHVLPDGAYLKV
ncbi:hypothetical protein ABMA28_001376 [Loxostege sticticalis]|uniref:FLYWCH-type domain-containing protein n=1 Tax=Loxostege sticticalis TaxID=481309 RepID=A0ABD0T1F9_LOXSC